MELCVFYEHVKSLAKEENWSIQKSLEFVKKQGIEAVDVSYGEIQENPFAFCEMAKENGFHTASVYGRFPFRSIQDLPSGRKFVDDALKAGAHHAMILPSVLEKGEDRLEALRVLTPALEILSQYAFDKGAVLSLENYSLQNRPYSLISDFEYIFSHAPHVSMTLDMGNFAVHKEDPLQAVEKFKEHVRHVHVKNWGEPELCRDQNIYAENLEGKTFYAYPAAEGGLVDIASIVEKLKKAKYDGALSIEIFGVSPMKEGIEKSAAFLKKCLHS